MRRITKYHVLWGVVGVILVLGYKYVWPWIWGMVTGGAG